MNTKKAMIEEFQSSLCVGVPGLEPGKTGPESVVLPITPYPKLSIIHQNAPRSDFRLQIYGSFLKQQSLSAIFLEIPRTKAVFPSIPAPLAAGRIGHD